MSGIERATSRKPDYPVEKLIYERWSPRAFTGEALNDQALRALLEAARWAPSSFNEQPWRFLYARRDTPAWNIFFDLLVEGNRRWAHQAALLALVVSKKKFTKTGKPNRNHSFDSGAAWENLALQATAAGWAAHGMAGFDVEKARRVLAIPEDYEVEAMLAVGRPTDKSVLPEELRAAEEPSGRHKIQEWATEGKFHWPS